MKTARRKFMVPIPKVPDLDVLNERLLARCLERLDALQQSAQASALLADLDALRDLPAAPFEACEHMPGQVSSTALVRYRLVDYSAPVVHAHKKVTIKGYVDRVEIALGAEIIARPPAFLCPRRRGLRPVALSLAAGEEAGGAGPGGAAAGMEARSGLRRAAPSSRSPLRTARGKRDYIQTLRLLEDFPERQVTAAVQDAVKRRLIGFDAVKHLLLARIEKRPVRLDLTRYPHLPQPFVAATRAADYAALLAAGHG